MSVVEERVRAGGLLHGPIAVLLSGGRDSVCLLDLAARLAGPVTALHVNYGLRASADGDATHCAVLCERLGVPLRVHRAGAPAGNLQAWARDVRYAEAAKLDGLIATGHTATDQVETVLYRLAASPGRRALLGMPERDGRLVRPLLTSTREETAAHCAERGLEWREDPTNADPAFARNRVRHELLPALRSLHPAAEANVLRTLAILRDEAEVLDALVPAEPDLDRLAALPPALARLALVEMAGAPIGARVPEILALSRSGTQTLDLGGGLRAVAEYGRLRFDHGPAAPPAAAVLPVPGAVAYGAGRLTCEEADDGAFDADALGARLDVRPWRAGDRMRPVGAGGSRTLQDLFTDRKVPRERRALVPVVVAGDEIAWVPGVATGERFAATTSTKRRVAMSFSPEEQRKRGSSGDVT
ncbi:MAG TPA: tRNA lysidine(34) synthetase TilS [Solirubrobacteraceae bacterium]